MNFPEAPALVPVFTAVLAMLGLLYGAQDPRLCGGCHTIPLLGVGSIAAAAGVISGLALARRR